MPQFPQGRDFNPGVLRIAQVTAVHEERGTIEITYYDRAPNREGQVEVPTPHPFGSKGWGVLTGVEEGTWVTVGFSYNDKPYILGTVTSSAFLRDSLGETAEARFDRHPFRRMDKGTVCLQSRGNSIVEATCDGDVLLRNTSGDFIRIHDETQTITSQSAQNYTFDEGHRIISGLVMRDRRPQDQKFPNEGRIFAGRRLTDPEFDQFLESVGRNPLRPTIHLERGTIQRNPGLSEVREVVYEFGLSFNVDDETIVGDRTYQPPFSDTRQTTRANILFPKRNELIESVKGTLVDVDGNILDINFLPIDIRLEDTEEELKEKLFRSVAYHVQFNSRKKDFSPRDPLRFSNWSLSVDKEGLTKLNIPASSDIGTVPRYMDIAYNDAQKNGDGELDKREFEAAAVEQDGGHIYHNIVNTGRRAVFAGTASFDDIPLDNFTSLDEESGVTEFEPSAITSIGEEDYNPAGISLKAKMDGLWATSIGRSAQDGTSIILDTAGKVVHHYGFDQFGRSAIIDMDGNMRMHIGHGKENLKSSTDLSDKLMRLGEDLIPEDSEGESFAFVTEVGGAGNSAKIVTDGSVELFLGADFTDLKSLLLQTEGLVAASLGRNKTFNSLVISADGSMDLQLGSAADGHSFGMQAEGAVIWNIGGGKSPLDGEDNEEPGKLDIRVAGTIGDVASSGAQRFIIDNQGITLSADGSIVLDTRGSQGTGQILAVAQKEFLLESLGGGIVIKANGISSDKAGIILDCPTGIMLRAGPNYIHVSPAGIIMSGMPIAPSPPGSPDTAPETPSLTTEIER